MLRNGEITLEDYSELISRVNSTGNTFNIQIELKILDDNSSRVTTTKDARLNGEFKYYSVYTNDVIKKLFDVEVYKLKQNDYIIVTVENENITIGTQFRSFIYKIMGKDTKVIKASASATIL